MPLRQLSLLPGSLDGSPLDHASGTVSIPNEDEFRTAILHQDLKLIAFFLAAIIVMLGVVAYLIQSGLIGLLSRPSFGRLVLIALLIAVGAFILLVSHIEGRLGSASNVPNAPAKTAISAGSSRRPQV